MSGLSEDFGRALKETTEQSLANAMENMAKEGDLLRDEPPEGFGLPPDYRRQLARWVALDEASSSLGPGALMERRNAFLGHYGRTLPELWVRQRLCAEGAAATFFQTALDWAALPRLTTAIKALMGEASAGALLEAVETLGEMFDRACFGRSGPMLYAYPHDLASYAAEVEMLGGDRDALHAVIDRRLAAPMVHELSHGTRESTAQRLMPPILDECISGYLGVAAMPELAFPSPGQDNALMGAPWFAQVGQTLASVFGRDRIRQAHFGSLRWRDALPTDLPDAMHRLGDAFFLEGKGVHMLDGNTEPEVWQKLFYLAAQEPRGLASVELEALRALPWTQISLPPLTAERAEREAETAEAALSAMTLVNLQDGACFRVRRGVPDTAIILDVDRCELRRERASDEFPHAPPLRHHFPPRACERWRQAGILQWRVNLPSLEAIPASAATLLAGP